MQSKMVEQVLPHNTNKSCLVCEYQYIKWMKDVSMKNRFYFVTKLFIFFLGVPLFLGACSSSGDYSIAQAGQGGDSLMSIQEHKIPFFVEVEIEADEEINLDEKGRATPVVFFAYVLKNSDGFEGADFADLKDDGKDVLTEDVLYKKKFMLKPGETKFFKQKVSLEATSLGFFASFRDLDDSLWKTVYPLPEPQIYQKPSFFQRKGPSSAPIKLYIKVNKKGIILKEREAKNESNK